MNLASLSIKRPIFIACIVTLMLIVGYISLKNMPVDLFPDVTIPVVTVRTTYPGAGPEEIETQISKLIEDQVSSVAGIDTLRSVNSEGLSLVVIEFDLKVDVKYAQNQVRDKVALVRGKLPDDIDEPIIGTVDPSDQPILVASLTADVPPGELYDYANEVIKPRLTQVDKVGQVDILGGRRREIQVHLDRQRLRAADISASQVKKMIAAAGKNVPVGKVDKAGKENNFRAVGEFRDLERVGKTVVRFSNNENAMTVGQLGDVVDTLVDETSRTFVNQKQSVLLSIFRQSKANTLSVVDGLQAQIKKINKELENDRGNPKLVVVRDGSARIRANVYDVNESIVIGIILTIIVVYFFLGSGRSTFITSLALPNSLLGAFILMSMAGFSINIMSLLALSLSVGLLIDDAIVVRENIFRHMEMGKRAYEASLVGTTEVTLAVIATTFTILAVFGPIGFLSGIVGQYLKEFGLTICFAMLISLFDALTIAPMMSAYFAGSHAHGEKKPSRFFLFRWNAAVLKAFDRFQARLENGYEWLLHKVLKFPISVIGLGFAVFVVSIMLMKYIPKTFLPPQDNGEASIDLDLPPGTSIDAMAELAQKVDAIVLKNKEVDLSVLTIGNANGEANHANFFIRLVDSHHRKINTSQFKDMLREQMKPYAYANPQIGDGQASGSSPGSGSRPFNVNIVGADLATIEKVSTDLMAKIKNHPALKDVDTSFRPGKPELQVAVNNERATMLGVQTATMGDELRTMVQGDTPAVFRAADREYDVRVRLKPEQRNLKEYYREIVVPNMNGNLVPLAAFARPIDTSGPATILRENRSRYIQISGDVAPQGPGMGGAITDVTKYLTEQKLPVGVSYSFVGQAKRFGELLTNMAVAMGLGILFIFLVLASLYESFITPFAIMLVFPLAICGALFGLLITQQSLDLFSMIGCVMLLGLATKNSILLVDYANHRLSQGVSRYDAIIEAGRTRLRPILMTTFALIAGMVPVAVGLNEASKQRVSLGVAIIGGTISSTLLTLIVVPAAYSYIDRFREWVNRLFFKYIGSKPEEEPTNPETVSAHP